MNGVLYLPVGEQMGINELEESAMSFSSRLSSQHTSLAIIGSVKILLEIPAKVKANHRQRWLVFIQCIFPLPTLATTAQFLRVWVSLQMNSPL